MSIMTVIIILITAGVSLYAFRDTSLLYRLSLTPYEVFRRKEYWRLITHGFVHADWVHLLVNMFVLYSFGRLAERIFADLASYGYLKHPQFHFLMLYFGGLVVSAIPSLVKHRQDPWYHSVGASGAVSAVIFISIFFQPKSMIFFYFIPIPAILFGVLYLGYSHYMARHSDENINHDAHFYGAVFGFLYPLLIHPSLFKVFWGQLF